MYVFLIYIFFLFVVVVVVVVLIYIYVCVFLIYIFFLLLLRNGDTYAGEYFADKMHGFGVYHFANGHRYEGAWHEGRRQGLGMYTFRNGETQSGHWQNGVLDIPSTQNTTYPVSPVAVYHSKVLNAVQVPVLFAYILFIIVSKQLFHDGWPLVVKNSN